MNLVTLGVHVVCAVLIIACITFWVWKPTSDFIDSNKKKLDKDRNELILNTKETRYFLSLLKKEKLAMAALKRKIEGDAKQEAERIIFNAKDSVNRLEEAMKKESEHRIRVMEEKAKSKIKDAVKDLAVELTEKLLEANINTENNKVIIDSYIKDLENKKISSTKIG